MEPFGRLWRAREQGGGAHRRGCCGPHEHGEEACATLEQVLERSASTSSPCSVLASARAPEADGAGDAARLRGRERLGGRLRPPARGGGAVNNAARAAVLEAHCRELKLPTIRRRRAAPGHGRRSSCSCRGRGCWPAGRWTGWHAWSEYGDGLPRAIARPVRAACRLGRATGRSPCERATDSHSSRRGSTVAGYCLAGGQNRSLPGGSAPDNLLNLDLRIGFLRLLVRLQAGAATASHSCAGRTGVPRANGARSNGIVTRWTLSRVLQTVSTCGVG